MDLQIIKTETGEELIVLTRRAYDALLARLGDEEAEDRMTVRLADEVSRRLASGENVVLPNWFADAMTTHRSAVKAVRSHFGKTQQEFAAAIGIGQGHLSDIERGAKPPTLRVLDAISAAVGIDPGILRAIERERAQA
jgi:DNA-binding XRE family transcriptional regulator